MNAPKKYRLFIMAKRFFALNIEVESIERAKAFVEAFEESLNYVNLWRRLTKQEKTSTKRNFALVAFYDEKGWRFFE